MTWRKPAACADDGGCIETVATGNLIGLRVTDEPGHVLLARRAEFTAFVQACRNGEYDDLCEVPDAR